MLEGFVMAICIYGTEPACLQGAHAYYSYSGIEHAVTEKQKQIAVRYPVASTIVGYTAAMFQQQLTVNLGKGKSCAISTKTGIISYKMEF